MKLFVSLAFFICSTTGLCAQDNRLSREETVGYAKACISQIVLGDAQIAMDVQPAKAVAVRGEGGGAMVIPDKSLSLKSAAKIGKEIVPVGQLWLRKWTLAVNGKPVANKRLRIVTPNLDDKDRPMPLLLLGLRQNADQKVELVVYAKGQKPLQVIPIEKTEIIQKLPVEMEWQRGEKNIDRLPLTIVGRYQVTLNVTRQ